MIVAEHKAEELVTDLGLNLPIIPEDVCKQISDNSFRVSYQEKPMQTDVFCGMSIGHNGGAVIVVNEGIENQGRKNFTGAHEIGHVILHIETGKQHEFRCTTFDVGTNTVRKFEQEANEFASALLMPKSIIGKLVLQNELSWQLIHSIKRKCDTSLEATARRMINLSNEVCALVIHKNGKMWMPIKSRSFKFSKFFINTLPFPKGLETFPDLPLDKLPDDLLECDASDWWISGKGLPDSILYSSIRNDEYDRTMTLLIIPEADDDTPEWDTPTFNR